MSGDGSVLEPLDKREYNDSTVIFDEFRRIMSIVRDKGLIYQPRFKSEYHMDRFGLICSALLNSYQQDRPSREDMIAHASYLLAEQPSVLTTYKDYECGIDRELVEHLSDNADAVDDPMYDPDFDRLFDSVYDDLAIRIRKGAEFIDELMELESMRRDGAVIDLRYAQDVSVGLFVEDYAEPQQIDISVYDDPIMVRAFLGQRVDERRFKLFGPFIKKTRDGDVAVFGADEPRIVILEDVRFSHRVPPKAT